MNKIKYLTLVIMCLFIVGCSNKMSPDITMKIKEGTLTNAGATLIIKDKTGDDHTYGDWYRIDKKENNGWVKQEPIVDDYYFNMIGYIADENNEVELPTNWESLYGELSKGEYRIVKTTLDGKEFYAEFTIE